MFDPTSTTVILSRHAYAEVLRGWVGSEKPKPSTGAVLAPASASLERRILPSFHMLSSRPHSRAKRNTPKPRVRTARRERLPETTPKRVKKRKRRHPARASRGGSGEIVFDVTALPEPGEVVVWTVEKTDETKERAQARLPVSGHSESSSDLACGGALTRATQSENRLESHVQRRLPRTC